MRIVRDDAEEPARFFRAFGRHHLLRRAASSRGEDSPTATIWKNVVTEAKSKAAETLDEFRGNYKYNLTDKNVLAMNAEIPVCRAVGRPRGHQQLVAARSRLGAASTSARSTPSQEHAHACRARRERFPRIHADPCNARARSTASTASFPTARCSTSSCSTRAAIAARMPRTWSTATARPRTSSDRTRSMAQAAAEGFARRTWKVIACDMPLALHRTYDFGPSLGAEGSRAERLARRADGSLSSPTFSRSSSVSGSATRSGSPPTCTTRRRTITIRARRVPGFRPVLGVRRRSAPRRHRAGAASGRHIRAAGRVQQGPAAREPDQSRPELRHAVLRPRLDRRRKRGDDGFAQGHR